MTEPIFVTCLGLICPVGLTPESAGAAMRSGIAAFSELPYIDNEGEPIVGAVAPCVPTHLRGRARLIGLLSQALASALESLRAQLPGQIDGGQLPLLLCTREPERAGPSVKGIVAEIETRLKLTFPRDGSNHIASGHVAAFDALSSARRFLSEHRASACLIAAVDTLCDAQALLWLERTKRLKTPLRSDGVIPGEAACVTLVTARRVMPSSAAVLGLGFAAETATVLNEEPLLGSGMTAAVTTALADARLAMHDIGLRTSDVGGESLAFEELSLTLSRVLRQRVEELPLWHPADCVGDTGACAGLIQFAIAEHATTRRYAPGDRVLCHGSNAGGARAAAVLGTV